MTSDAERYKTAGDTAFSQQDYTAAIAQYTLCLLANPKPELASRVLSNRCAAYTNQGDLKAALVDSTDLMNIAPEWPKSYVRHGGVLLALDFAEKAAVVYRKGLDVDPEDGLLKEGYFRCMRVLMAHLSQTRVHASGLINRPVKTTPLTPVFERFRGGVIRQVAVGASHVIILTEAGALWGLGAPALLGASEIPILFASRRSQHTTINWASDEFTPLPFKGKTFAAVACGAYFTAALTSDGHVYTWGLNHGFCLGRGKVEYSGAHRVDMPASVIVTHIACGRQHTLALTSTGDVYAWGQNDQGQLGIDNTESKEVGTPTLVPRLSNVVSISCGVRHSAAVLSDGALLTWGGNHRGQLGYIGYASALIDSTVPPGTLVADIAKAYLADTGAFTDFTLTLGPHAWRLHRCMLCARLPAAAAFLRENPTQLMYTVEEFLMGCALAGPSPTPATLARISEGSPTLTTAHVDILLKWVYGAFVEAETAMVAGAGVLVSGMSLLVDVLGVGHLRSSLIQKGVEGIRSAASPLFVSSSTAAFTDDMKALHQNRLFSDVELEAEGVRLPAHSFVLSARSSYFRMMYSSGFEEAVTGLSRFPNETAATLSDVIKFLYFDKVVIEMGGEEAGAHVIQLLNSAKTMDILRLQKALERAICESVDTTNVCGLASYAESMGADMLLSYCIKTLVGLCDEVPVASIEGFRDMPTALQDEVTLGYALAVEQRKKAKNTTPNRSVTSYTPKPVLSLLRPATFVVCADKFTAVVCSGALFQLGEGAYRHGKRNATDRPPLTPDSVKPFLWKEPEDVTSVSCGSAHAIATTSSGRLYGWGYCNMEQVPKIRGRAPRDKFLPKVEGTNGHVFEWITTPEDVSVVATGRHSSLLIGRPMGVPTRNSSLDSALQRMLSSDAYTDVTLDCVDGPLRSVRHLLTLRAPALLETLPLRTTVALGSTLIQLAVTGRVEGLADDERQSFDEYLATNCLPSRTDPHWANQAAEMGAPDFVFTCDDNSALPCHSLVAAARSPYLANKLWKDNYTTIPLPGVSTNVARALIAFLYSGVVELPHESLRAVAAAAFSLGLTDVLAVVDVELTRTVELHTVIGLLVLALEYCLFSLQHECCAFITKNPIVRSSPDFLQLPLKARLLAA